MQLSPPAGVSKQMVRRIRIGRGLVVLAFGLVVVWAALLPYFGPPRSFAGGMTKISSHRSDIVDRNHRLLATNMPVRSLYAHPHNIQSTESAERMTEALARIVPGLNRDAALKKLTGSAPFVWLANRLSPDQYQAIVEIGEAGLEFGRREARLYPNGRLAAHVLGGNRIGRQDAHGAEIIGTAGVELQYNEQLSDPTRHDEPLVLSLDMKAQKAVEDVLAAGTQTLRAHGGSAVLIDVHSGELYAIASYPDFDPNHRNTYDLKDKTAANPLFHRAAQSLLELGSVFKVFAVATALELGLVEPDTVIDTREFLVDTFRIRDVYSPRNERTVTEIVTKSSNVGVARLALEFGQEAQREYLERFGFGQPVDILESRSIEPMWPSYWAKSTTATIAYGYGLSVTPIHLAAAYASLVNGGYRVAPTILRRDSSDLERPAILSTETSRNMREMLRLNVEEGSGTQARIDGYPIGGKTGTSLKIKGGKYVKNKVYAVFAACFPADDPRFVLVVVLDEPQPENVDDILAGNTVVPVAAEMITRLSPILGIRPSKSDTLIHVASLR